MLISILFIHFLHLGRQCISFFCPLFYSFGRFYCMKLLLFQLEGDQKGFQCQMVSWSPILQTNEREPQCESSFWFQYFSRYLIDLHENTLCNFIHVSANINSSPGYCYNSPTARVQYL